MASGIDTMDRRGMLKCMGWAGTGALFTLASGVAQATSLEAALNAPPSNGLRFVQLSDSHIGFDKPANPDVHATFREAVAKVKALPAKPDFILHTGDITHLSRDQEFA